MLLRFKASPRLISLHEKPDYWYPGDERETAEPKAAELLAKFPDNFEVVTKAAPVPVENKAVASPKNKTTITTTTRKPPKRKRW